MSPFLFEIVLVTIPLLIAGLVHHWYIIPRNSLSKLAVAIDGGVTLNKKPLLGKSKTIRGILVIVVITGVSYLALLAMLPYELPEATTYIGFLIGLGYALGELPNSLLKRQVGISPSQQKNDLLGHFFGIMDHVDSIIGVAIVLFFFTSLPSNHIFIIGVIGVVLHLFIDWLLYQYGYKKNLKSNQSDVHQ